MNPKLLIASLLLGLPVYGLDLGYSHKGADGEFSPSGATFEVDLSRAATAAWDAVPTEPGRGVYDTNKWAVVFKFTSINIPAGTKVTFKNHPSRAPVVWLVDGDATIAGMVDLSGGASDTDPTRLRFPEPGPGGFRGGDAAVIGSGWISGFGPGGAFGLNNSAGGHQWASFATDGYTSGSFATVRAYGSPSLIPLIGGSGGGFDTRSYTYGGSGGGGALLLAVKGNLELSGSLEANSGSVVGSSGYAEGSGGAIRILCETASGTGSLRAVSGGAASHGRLRLESPNPGSFTGFSILPPTVPVTPANPAQLWPEAAAPTARIVSVNALNAPPDPRASLTALAPADLRLPIGSRTNLVTIETLNLPTDSVVTLRVVSTPTGGDVRLNADYLSTDPENPNRHLWRKEVVIEPGYHALQVVARAP